MWHFILWQCLVLLSSNRPTVLWLVLHGLQYWTKIVMQCWKGFCGQSCIDIWQLGGLLFDYASFSNIFPNLFSSILTQQHHLQLWYKLKLSLTASKMVQSAKAALKGKSAFDKQCVRRHRCKDSLLWNYLVINCRLGSVRLGYGAALCVWKAEDVSLLLQVCKPVLEVQERQCLGVLLSRWVGSYQLSSNVVAWHFSWMLQWFLLRTFRLCDPLL